MFGLLFWGVALVLVCALLCACANPLFILTSLDDDLINTGAFDSALTPVQANDCELW